MKYLLITLGSIGDVMPFLAVADALRQRGHHAVIASNAGYAGLVRGSGFEFAIVSERPPSRWTAFLKVIRTRHGAWCGRTFSLPRRALCAPLSPIMRNWGLAG